MRKTKNTKEEMKIFYDALAILEKTPKAFKDIFEVPLDLWANKIAFIYEENGHTRRVKYGDLSHLVLSYGAAFLSCFKDIKKGEYIGLKLNNSPRWIYSFFGLLSAGYKVLLINPILNAKDTNRLLNEVNAKGLIIDKDNPEYIGKTININNLIFNFDKSFTPTWEDEASFSTSGTTGDSRVYAYKGINMFHQINATYNMPDTTLDIMYDSRFGQIRHLMILPLSHIFGFTAVFMLFFFFGMTLVFPPNLSPKNIATFAKKYKISHIFAVPLLWDSVAKTFKETLMSESKKKQDLVNRAIEYTNEEISATEAGIATSQFVRDIIKKKILGKEIRFAIAGGSALSLETLKTINGLDYPLYNGYGMTEIGITSVELSPDVKQRNKGSIGKPLNGVEYKISDGELLVKAPQIHSFRYVDGKKLPPLIDEEGYFHTGDIATMDEEGYYYIKGKNKDVIILANGENIYPEDLENSFKNIPNISNLAIIEDKEVLTLILEFMHALNKEEIKKVEKVIAEDNEKLPKVMQVQRILLSKEPLPINASMKIKRFELIENVKYFPERFVEINRVSLFSLDGLDEKEISKLLEDIIPFFALNTGFKKDEIANNSHFVLDLAGDSFSYMSLVGDIENKYEITIDNEQLGKLNTPTDFAVYIYKSLHK